MQSIGSKELVEVIKLILRYQFRTYGTEWVVDLKGIKHIILIFRILKHRLNFISREYFNLY